MSNIPKVCFVTNELYPVNKGGIGRFIYNMLFNEWEHEVEFSLLLYGENFKSTPESIRQEVAEVFEGRANIYFAEDFLLGEKAKLQMANPAFFDALYLDSYHLHLALEEIQAEKSEHFDYVEFLDFGGPALVSANARKLGVAKSNALVGIRLHSTSSIISENEVFETPYSEWHNVVHDAERLALSNADYVVSHLDTISQYNKAF